MPDKPSNTEHPKAEKSENDKALRNLVKALERGKSSTPVMEQIEKSEIRGKRLDKEIELEVQRLKHERYTVDSFEAVPCSTRSISSIRISIRRLPGGLECP